MPSSKEEISDSDDGFSEDMEALRRACQLIDETPTSTTTAAAASGIASPGSSSEGDSVSEGDDDHQLVQSIQKRFAFPTNLGEEPLKTKPSCTVLPDWSDSEDIEDDYETLRAIQRRFSAYNDGSLKDNFEEFSHTHEQVGATIIDSEKETSNSFVERTNAREGFLNCVDTSEPTGKNVEACDNAGGSSDLAEWNETGVDDEAELPLRTSQFPNSALAFVDAIKKNRLCQKLIRSKMMQVEARMEELDKLIEGVRILKNFQVDSKKRIGRSFSQKKDPRVRLISVPKLKANLKPNENNIPASCKGPPENVHVPNYKEAMETFSIPCNKEKWSKEERENLLKGVKQQFQEMLLQQCVDRLNEANGYYESSNVDSIMETIKETDLTPERMRQFLPKVNWEQLAAMYVPRRTGAECQVMYLNSEDPLINHGPWTAMEDKNILHIIQEKGFINWIDFAATLGTNRTPFQCLSRYQRSLNASILKREWTSEEDNQLRAAVETYGESNWQVVANALKGRTGTQCSNRWLKTLHPARKRSGTWTLEEDKRLKVAVTLFGAKTWRKVAKCVPGRTHVQCRERWVNCLDPSIIHGEWTREEDLLLQEAIAKHGYCWSKVAACIPHRTDNLCLRRWKVLCPAEVPLLQTARKIQKVALISNFVDRESERPALGPKDFLLPEPLRITGNENIDPSTQKKKISRRRRGARKHNEEDDLSSENSEVVLMLTDGNELEMQGSSVHREGTRRSTRLRKRSTRLLDVYEGEEITEPRVSDGNTTRKSRPQKKRSGKDAATTSAAVISDEACFEEYKHLDPGEEPTPEVELGGKDAIITQPVKVSKLHPRKRKSQVLKEAQHLDPVEEPTLEVELGGKDAIITQPAKASKLHLRKRKSQVLKEGQQTKSKAPRQAVMKRRMKMDKKLTNATDDHPLSFPDPDILVDDTRATEAGSTEGKNIEDMQLALVEIEGDDMNLASSLQQPGDDATSPSPFNVDDSLRKRKKSSQIHIFYQCKRRKTGDGDRSKQTLVEEGLRRDDQAEAGDDMTIAQILQQIKERRK
ncbi:hypothetical protein SASPL_129199 [Salvia splendens]|uniref:Myb proto-oncogene protein, plant n=1 Tax=Salvia splendens TaxID=180675 RepID=A0A8X8XFA2_SALSN|nr:uncharacterized protein LOC121752131 [Salvia splendens]KAG6411125.1 hypothetical protein SASPL_129199 [Salvia splendens]